MDIDYTHHMHELACEAGVLSTMFAWNSFDKIEAKDLDVVIKMDKQVSVREAADLVDIAGGQGVLKCNCGKKCDNMKCICRKKKVLWNLRCHQGNNQCVNKGEKGIK